MSKGKVLLVDDKGNESEYAAPVVTALAEALGLDEATGDMGYPTPDVPKPRKRRTKREAAAALLTDEAVRLAEKQAKHMATAAAIGAEIQALRDQIDALMGNGHSGQARAGEAA